MVSKNQILLSFGTLGLIIVTSGCGSKFSESSAKSVTIKGFSLSDRMAQKEKIDGRIDEIQKGVDKAKKIIDLMRQVQNPSSEANTYTPLDFLLDLNTELKTKIPENRGEKLMRFAKVRIPISTLPEECQTLDSALESSIIYSDETVSKTAVGERLTYSLKGCGSETKYSEVLVANWIGSDLELKVLNKNLEPIFKDMLKSISEKSSNCKFKLGEKQILESLFCENLQVKLSTSETAEVSNLSFSNVGDIRYEAKAEIFENAQVKAHFYFKVLSNGEKELVVKKVGEE
jgi:hypothetical protein